MLPHSECNLAFAYQGLRRILPSLNTNDHILSEPWDARHEKINLQFRPSIVNPIQSSPTMLKPAWMARLRKSLAPEESRISCFAAINASESEVFDSLLIALRFVG